MWVVVVVVVWVVGMLAEMSQAVVVAGLSSVVVGTSGQLFLPVS